MTDSTARPPARPPTVRRTWLLWFAGALAFPIAGLGNESAPGKTDGLGPQPSPSARAINV
jgi:hypothetical protein